MTRGEICKRFVTFSRSHSALKQRAPIAVSVGYGRVAVDSVISVSMPIAMHGRRVSRSVAVTKTLLPELAFGLCNIRPRTSPCW